MPVRSPDTVPPRDRASAGLMREDPGAASVIVLKRDDVLMVLRDRPPFAGVWSFPGGRAEAEETPIEAARRELLEETGLVLRDAIQIGAFQPVAERPDLWLTVFAAADDDVDGRAPAAGDDAAEAAFVPLGAVLERPTTAGAAGWIARAVAALEHGDRERDRCA